jgi:hypothetical protein
VNTQGYKIAVNETVKKELTLSQIQWTEKKKFDFLIQLLLKELSIKISVFYKK